jgi:divalent metal cation (Fe/Co/Zn/Cd) transporter
MTTHSGSKIAVVAAIAGNLLIAIIKFIAAALTGSSAMVSEGIHSVVDTGNGNPRAAGIEPGKKAGQ